MQNDKYRACPICRSRLSELMDRVEHGVKWKVYECKNCGSEVWINPFKRLIESIKR
jgi:DNA-directed RNA polymerase subunit RPC12/RpoP